MKFSKFFSAVCVAVMTASVFSCTPPAGEGPNAVELNQNISFTLLVSDVTTESAKVTVTHDGDRNDTWYGFVTTEGNITGAVEAKVLELLSSGKISVKKTASTTVSLSGLEPGTDYYYVVFGLTAEGIVYGEPESVFFTTEDLPSAITYRENTAWNVRYTGEGTINGNKYDHTVTVNSTDKNYYIISVYTADTFNQYGIDAIANDAVADLEDWIASYNQQNNANITFSQMLYQGNGMDAFYLDAGESYRAVAVGAGTNGQPTGLYALSDVFTIADSGSDTEMSKEYSAWLGDWKFTGANGISQNVTFSKNVANESYKMTGYEGDESEGFDIIVEWNAENHVWVIYNQNFGVYDFGASYGEGKIWFVGENAKGEFYLSDGIPICIGGMYEDGTLGAIGYEEEWQNEDGSKESFSVNDMLYLVHFETTNKVYYLTEAYKTGFPTFPITITPKTKSLRPAKAVRMAKAAERYSEREYKVFGQHK